MTTTTSSVIAGTITDTLAEFIVDTQFEDLPEDVVDYTKLLILDSLICGIGASQMERTQLSHKLADRIGGAEDATVFGRKKRVPAKLAASLNSEIMNLLDADDTFFNTAHFVIMNLAGGLAEAERLGATGRELIRSVAIGFDIAARFNIASSFVSFKDGEFNWSKLIGSGYASMGTAVSAGIVAGLDAEQMSHALALVAGTAPTARNSNSATRTEIGSYKWAPNFHLGECGMNAVMMAEAGYLGEKDLIDLEPGFIEGQGFMAGDLDKIRSGLGEQWWIRDSAVKFFPGCRYTSAPAAALQKFMADNALVADDIEGIEVRLNPAAYSMTVFNSPETSFEMDHRAPMKAQFNIPFVLAQVALGRTPGPEWYSDEAFADPRTWEMAKRITTSPDPSLNEEWDAQINDSLEGRPRRTRGSLTIRANGHELVVESDYAPGDPWSEETKPTWETVTEKFHNFCGEILSAEEINSIVEAVRGLDSIENVTHGLTPLLVNG